MRSRRVGASHCTRQLAMTPVLSTATMRSARFIVSGPWRVILKLTGSTTITTESLIGTMSNGVRSGGAVGDVGCVAGLVSERETDDDEAAPGASGELSSEEAAGAGAHTSGRMRNDGTHDSASAASNEEERAAAREDEAEKTAAGAAAAEESARARGLPLTVLAEKVTCADEIAHVTTLESRGVVRGSATLDTKAVVAGADERESPVVASGVMNGLESRSGTSIAPPSNSGDSGSDVELYSTIVTGSAPAAASGGAAVPATRDGGLSTCTSCSAM